MSALRTTGSLPTRSGAWLYHWWAYALWVFTASMPCFSSRSPSRPRKDAALACPLRIRLVAVASLATTLKTTDEGVPAAEVVAPSGPHA